LADIGCQSSTVAHVGKTLLNPGANRLQNLRRRPGVDLEVHQGLGGGA